MSKTSTRSIIVFVILLVFFCCVVLLPLLRPGFYKTDDGDWMIIRLSAFFQSWREGQFPVRFLGRLNHGYGYPVSNFLYPGYLYIGSLIHALGVSFVGSVKVVLFASTVLGTLSTFFWLKHKFSPMVSLFGALNFLLSPYLLYDLFTRGSVGEVLAIGVAAFGLYCLETRKRFWFTIAIAGIILSHNSLAVLFLIFFTLSIFVQKKFSFVSSIVVAFGMTSFFWVPALLERQFVLFDSIIVSNPLTYYATGALWYLVGIAGVLGGLVVLTEQKKLEEETLWYVFVFLLTVSFALPISTLVWQLPSVAKLFQFPYRMLSVSVIAGAFLVADALDRVSGSKRLVLMGMFGIIWIGTAVYVSGRIERTELPDAYYATNEATTTVANEYMPRWVHDLPNRHAPTKLEFMKGRGTFTDVTLTTNRIHTTVNALEDSLVQINTIYYPGWGAMLDNARATIIYDNPRGVMQIAVPHGVHELTVGFRETVPRFIITLFSVIVSIGYLLWIVIPKRILVSTFRWFQQLPESVNTVSIRRKGKRRK